MRWNMNRLDERIHKLQEIRRILSDPEAAAILQELLSNDEPASELPATVESHSEAAAASATGDAESTELLKTLAAKQDEGSQNQGLGVWGLRRR
jgi:hypothetical protein